MSDKHFLPHIARMQGYVPGEQPQDSELIKLNTNENPYPPSPRVLERIRDACDGNLRRYPDAGAHNVRCRLGELFGVAAEQTLIGNGSDELLNIAVRCFVGPGDKVVYPWPTYSYYDKLVHMQDGRIVKIDFAADFTLPTDLPIEDARLTCIANPNSPSGTLTPVSVIATLAQRTRGILIVDEAYVDFTEGGCAHLIHQHPNVFVVRTMSKSFSLAGMRLGFGFAHADLVAGMWKVKDHYNINTLSLVAAAAALDDIATMQANAKRIRQTRDHLTRQLKTLGFSVWDSAANFVLARIAAPAASWLYEELKQRRILVRYFDQPRLHDCLRISVGTEVETTALIEALAELLD